MKNKCAKILVCVQARLGSARLPGKVLMKVLGKPIILLQLERIKKAKTINDIAIITSTSHQDNAIAKLCAENNIKYYRGSEFDLLDRHYQAAKKFKADFIVKIPSDCPLADPKVIDEVIGLW